MSQNVLNNKDDKCPRMSCLQRSLFHISKWERVTCDIFCPCRVTLVYSSWRFCLTVTDLRQRTGERDSVTLAKMGRCVDCVNVM